MFIPQLTTTDWNKEWIELQKARRRPDDSAHWNKRAQTYHKPEGAPSLYVQKFIEYAAIEPKDVILDMGCGTGALSIPLAQAGHKVIAADFSQGMLSVLQTECERAGIAVEEKLMSWQDDWPAFGVGEKSVDVACASRSIITENLQDSLQKISKTARRRCAITLPAGISPRSDERILQAIGLESLLGKDFLYAFMVLTSLGYFPEVRYIPSERYDTYASVEEAFASLSKMVEDVAAHRLEQAEIEQALKRLRTWLDDNLIANPNAGVTDATGTPEGAYRLAHARKVTWVHIAWNV